MATVKTTKTVTKKTTPVKRTPIPRKIATTNLSNEMQNVVETPAAKIKMPQRKIIIPMLVIVAIGITLYVCRGLFIAAIVNGQPISRIQIISSLEKQGGAQVLDGEVQKVLVQQEIAKRNIVISDKEVNNQIKKFEAEFAKSGINLDDYLAKQHMKRADIIPDVRTELALQKILAKDITVTDKEIDAYITQNKGSFPDTMDEKTLRANVKAQLLKQREDIKRQQFTDDLKKKATIQHLVSY